MARPFPHVDGVEHRYVEARGLRIHVAEAGPPTPSRSLLLHGWPQHWYEWRRQIPALAAALPRDHARPARLRLVGRAAHGYDKENMATDVLALLDAMGLERVRLVGHDWGGWIGFIMCVRAPERFSRYLALNIPHLWAKTEPEDPARHLALLVPVGDRDARPRRVPGRQARLRPDYCCAASNPGGIWTEEELAAFTEPLREPDRARATRPALSHVHLREFGPVARRPLQGQAAHGPDATALRHATTSRSRARSSAAATRRSSRTTSRSSSCPTPATSSPRSGRSS